MQFSPTGSRAAFSAGFAFHRLAGPVLLACGALLAPVAQASKPLQTDDAALVERGRCEREGVIKAVQQPGPGGGAAASAAVNCAVWETVQLGLSYDQDGADPNALTRSVSLVGKMALWAPEGDDMPIVSLSGSTSWVPRPGLGTGYARSETAAFIVSSWQFGRAALHVNLGRVVRHAERDTATVFGVAAEAASVLVMPGLSLTPMAEVFGNSRKERGTTVAARLGFGRSASSLDVAWSRQWGLQAQRAITLAFSFGF